MEIKNYIVCKDTTIKEVLKKLEKYRCRMVYVVEDDKLIGSVSEGDIRRFLLNDNNIKKAVFNIMNPNPIRFMENQEEQVEKQFEGSELYSLPIVNYNNEIVAIQFRNKMVKKQKNMMQLPVVIMAGGKGTRLYPYTKLLPKALVPIGDIPILEHIINRFKEYGCTDYHLVVNHKKSMIRSYMDSVKDGYNVYYAEESEPLGTGGGLSLLADEGIKEFFLSNCDILIDADYKKIYDFHKENNNYITIVAAEKTSRIPYGVIESDNGVFKGMQEKPEQKCIINTGMYVVDGSLIHMIEKDKRVDFTDLIYKCNLEGKKVGVYTVEEKAYMDMGQLEELEKMKEQLGYKSIDL